MANENFVENLSSSFGQAATVKNLFGEPVQANGKTIIPVAKLAYGFGGGFGQGKKKPKRIITGNEPAEQDATGEGAGGGGGVHATAKGVFEISEAGTRFIPATPYRHLLAGVAIGFLLKAIFFSGRK